MVPVALQCCQHSLLCEYLALLNSLFFVVSFSSIIIEITLRIKNYCNNMILLEDYYFIPLLLFFLNNTENRKFVISLIYAQVGTSNKNT